MNIPFDSPWKTLLIIFWAQSDQTTRLFGNCAQSKNTFSFPICISSIQNDFKQLKTFQMETKDERSTLNVSVSHCLKFVLKAAKCRHLSASGASGWVGRSVTGSGRWSVTAGTCTVSVAAWNIGLGGLSSSSCLVSGLIKTFGRLSVN